MGRRTLDGAPRIAGISTARKSFTAANWKAPAIDMPDDSRMHAIYMRRMHLMARTNLNPPTPG